MFVAGCVRVYYMYLWYVLFLRNYVLWHDLVYSIQNVVVLLWVGGSSVRYLQQLWHGFTNICIICTYFSVQYFCSVPLDFFFYYFILKLFNFFVICMFVCLLIHKYLLLLQLFHLYVFCFILSVCFFFVPSRIYEVFCCIFFFFC